MTLPPRLCLVVAALLFSTGAAALKALSLEPLPRACFRSGIAACFLFVLLPRARARPSLRTLGLAAIFATSTTCTVMAVSNASAATALFLQAVSPLFVLLFGIALLGERPQRKDLGPVLLLAAGFGCLWSGREVAQATAVDPSRGLWFGTVGCVAWAFVVLSLRKVAAPKDAPVDPSQQVLVCGNALACVATAILAWPLPQPTNVDLAVLAYLGIVQIGTAYALLARGLRDVPAFAAALLLLLEPILSPVWAFLLHGERPPALALVGGVLALCGSVLGAAQKRNRSTV